MKSTYIEKDNMNRLRFKHISSSKRAKKLAKHLNKAYKHLVMLDDELDTLSPQDKVAIDYAKYTLTSSPLFSQI